MVALRTDFTRLSWAVVAIALSVIVGLGVALADVSTSALLVALSAVVIFTPVVWRVARGTRSSWLEPVVWAGATMGVIYVLRPLALLLLNQMGRFGYDLRPEFNKVLVLTCFGAACLYIGYFVLGGRRLAQRLPAPSDRLDQTTILLLSFATVFVGLALFAFGAMRSGTPVVEGMLHGFRIDPSKSSAYFYLAPTMALPAALLIYRTGSITGSRALKVSALLIAIPLAGVMAPAGSRFTTLYSLVPFLIYVMLRDRWRFRLLPFTAVCIVVLSFVVATQNFQPGQQGLGAVVSSTRAALESPSTTLENLMTGPTTAEFDALVIEQQIVPSELNFSPGITVTSTISQPVPRLLWPEKPRAADYLLNQVAFRHLTAGQGRMGEAFTPIGGLYFDSGWFGVGFGMLLIGWILRMLWRYFEAHRENDIVRIFYSISLPFVVVLMRGNVPDTMGKAVFFIVPLFTIAALAKRTGHHVDRPTHASAALTT